MLTFNLNNYVNNVSFISLISKEGTGVLAATVCDSSIHGDGF